MSDFGQFFEVKFPNIQSTIDQTHCEESILLKKACRMTWNARQSKIDQLKRLLVDANLNFDAANDEIKKLKAEKAVLDKRVYLALMIIQGNQYCTPDLAIQLGKVLRGEHESP